MPATAMTPPVDSHIAGLCILIVEDMPDELRLLARFLGGAGARVLMAVDGTEALRLAQLMRPDVVVMDVRLPPPDGLAVCRALQLLPQCVDIPVIFTSGLHSQQTKLAAFAAGARDYLTKPFTQAELIARVALHARLSSRWRTRLSAPDGALPRWLVTCLQRLQTSLDAPVSVADLANEVGTTVHSVNEGFRSHLHTTPAAFVREARLLAAARLLSDTDSAVASVAAELGYANPANFATAFKERFGVPPRQYRQLPRAADLDAAPSDGADV